jgi:protein-tyrosine-phosphatase
MAQAAQAQGIDLVGRARQVTAHDLAQFDYVLAMDRQNYRDLLVKLIASRKYSKDSRYLINTIQLQVLIVVRLIFNAQWITKMMKKKKSRKYTKM